MRYVTGATLLALAFLASPSEATRAEGMVHDFYDYFGCHCHGRSYLHRVRLGTRPSFPAQDNNFSHSNVSYQGSCHTFPEFCRLAGLKRVHAPSPLQAPCY